MKLLTLVTALMLACGSLFADEMDNGKNSKRPNLVIVKVDKDGNEVSYAAKVGVSKEDLKTPEDMQKVIQEVVVAKNVITPKKIKSLDEMDQTSSTPAWYYYGYVGWYNYNNYYYGYYNPYYYGYNYYWNTCYYPCNYWYGYNYRFYWC
jgi:hypothetical protein